VLLHDGILQGRILHYVHGAQTVFSTAAAFSGWVPSCKALGRLLNLGFRFSNYFALLKCS